MFFQQSMLPPSAFDTPNTTIAEFKVFAGATQAAALVANVRKSC